MPHEIAALTTLPHPWLMSRHGFMDERMMPHEITAITTLPHPWLMWRHGFMDERMMPHEIAAITTLWLMKCKNTCVFITTPPYQRKWSVNPWMTHSYIYSKMGPTHGPTPHRLNIHSLPTHGSRSLSLRTPRDTHNNYTEPKILARTHVP